MERTLIRIPRTADFEIVSGRLIRLRPVRGVNQKDIEIYLFGPVWAILCHQREMLPLHASAVLTKTGIAAFLGNSGVGKSFLAASMSNLSYKLVADDILVPDFTTMMFREDILIYAV